MSNDPTQPVRGLFQYPVPIDGHCDAVIMVPRDLRRGEADRIYRVLLSLCVESQASETSKGGIVTREEKV